MNLDIRKKLVARHPRPGVMRRIVRAYKHKIRRQLKSGSSFSFWHVIGNLDEDDLAKHIEQHFLPNMTWKNYGEWNLVNVKPLDGPIVTAKQFYQYVHYANYKPQWKYPRTPPILRNGRIARQG